MAQESKYGTGQRVEIINTDSQLDGMVRKIEGIEYESGTFFYLIPIDNKHGVKLTEENLRIPGIIMARGY